MPNAPTTQGDTGENSWAAENTRHMIKDSQVDEETGQVREKATALVASVAKQELPENVMEFIEEVNAVDEKNKLDPSDMDVQVVEEFYKLCDRVSKRLGVGAEKVEAWLAKKYEDIKEKIQARVTSEGLSAGYYTVVGSIAVGSIVAGVIVAKVVSLIRDNGSKTPDDTGKVEEEQAREAAVEEVEVEISGEKKVTVKSYKKDEDYSGVDLEFVLEDKNLPEKISEKDLILIRNAVADKITNPVEKSKVKGVDVENLHAKVYGSDTELKIDNDAPLCFETGDGSLIEFKVIEEGNKKKLNILTAVESEAYARNLKPKILAKRAEKCEGVSEIFYRTSEAEDFKELVRTSISAPKPAPAPVPASAPKPAHSRSRFQRAATAKTVCLSITMTTATKTTRSKTNTEPIRCPF